jgi:hypothetical protein
MRKVLLSVLAVGLLAVCGCMGGGMPGVPGAGGSKGGGGSSGGGKTKSAAQTEVEGLAAVEQPYMVMFHKNPKVGQFATKKMGGMEYTYAVVGGKSGEWVVEERRPCFSDKSLTVVIQKVVDNKGLVKKACAAELKKDAKELPVGVALKVGKKPETKTTGKKGKAPKEEAGPEVAGLKTRKLIMDVAGKKAISYMSKEAFFAMAMEHPSKKGGAVKSEYDGNVSFELLKQGVDKELAKPTVKMPE